MTFPVNIANLVTRIGTEFKAIRTLIAGSATGDVSGLNTAASNLVSAVNEVKATADAAAGGGVTINDAATNGTEAWSSTKIDAEISAAVSALLDGAPDALDTLNELAAAVNDDASFAASVTASLANKADTSAIYTQAQLGDPTTDYVATFNTALT